MAEEDDKEPTGLATVTDGESRALVANRESALATAANAALKAKDGEAFATTLKTTLSATASHAQATEPELMRLKHTMDQEERAASLRRVGLFLLAILAILSGSAAFALFYVGMLYGATGFLAMTGTCVALIPPVITQKGAITTKQTASLLGAAARALGSGGGSRKQAQLPEGNKSSTTPSDEKRRRKPT